MRLAQIERNKKRMEELGITDIVSRNLLPPSAPKAKPRGLPSRRKEARMCSVQCERYKRRPS